jgi:hypothetical protein
MLALMHVLTRKQGRNSAPIARRWTLAAAEEVWEAIVANQLLRGLLGLDFSDVRNALDEVLGMKKELNLTFWYTIKWLTTPEPTSGASCFQSD